MLTVKLFFYHSFANSLDLDSDIFYVDQICFTVDFFPT